MAIPLIWPPHSKSSTVVPVVKHGVLEKPPCIVDYPIKNCHLVRKCSFLPRSMTPEGNIVIVNGHHDWALVFVTVFDADCARARVCVCVFVCVCVRVLRLLIIMSSCIFGIHQQCHIVCSCYFNDLSIRMIHARFFSACMQLTSPSGGARELHTILSGLQLS